MKWTYKKNEGDGMVYPANIETKMFYYVPKEGYIDPTATELTEGQKPWFRPWVRTHMETLKNIPGNLRHWRWGHTQRAKYIGAYKNREGEGLLGPKIELGHRHYFADAPPHMGNNEMNEVNGQATKVLIENSGPDKDYEHLTCGGAEDLCRFYEEELKDADFILAQMSSSNGPGKKAWESCSDFKCTASSILEGKQDSATYARSCARVLQWFPLDKMCNARYLMNQFLPHLNVPPSPDELRQVGLPPTWRATPGENLGSAGWNLIGALVRGNVLPVSAMIKGVPKYIASFDNAPFPVKVPADLAKLLYAELAQSLHVDPMDVGLTIDVATIICNLFFLDQMNPPAAYDYPKDWEATQAALVAAAAAAAEDEGEDESQKAYAGTWTRELLDELREAIGSLAVQHPDGGAQA